MRRVIVCLVSACSAGLLALALAPSQSFAIDLAWSDGSRDLEARGAVVCTLLVRPSGRDALLPGQWRIVYSGTSSCPAESALVVLDASGPPTAATLCSLTGPSTEAEVRSRQVNAVFCGPGDGRPTGMAALVLRIGGGLRAHIAAVPVSGIGPDAQSAIAPGSEVTVNGGTSLDYPAAAWAATEITDSTGANEIMLTGVGMDRVRSAVLGPQPGAVARALRNSIATDGNDTLAIVARTPYTLVLKPGVAVSGGRCVVLTSATGGAVAAAPITARQATQAGTAVAEMVPGGTIRPKDFAFIHANGQFHLFYIRHDNALPDSLTEIDLGHAVSTDLLHWTQLPPVLRVEPTRWDNAHVWSPSIIQQGGTYYLFYTGVSRTPGYDVQWGYQRIGVATSRDLLDWTRYPAPVYGANDVPWAFADSTQWAGCQFRDPFVMVDPSNSGRWLMYEVATPRVQRTSTMVGMGQNATGLTPWSDLKPFWNTDTLHYQFACESPHVFPESGLWYLFFTTNSGHPIEVQYATDALADSSAWHGTWSLYSLLGANDPDVDSWYASEHLSYGGHDYLAFVHSDDAAIQIRELIWGPPPVGGARPVLSTAPPAVAQAPGPSPGQDLALDVSGYGASVELRAILPVPMRVLVDIFDAAGRRLRRLADGGLPAGVTMLSWNGTDDRRVPVSSGIYFARMLTPAGTRSARIVLVR